MVSSGAVGGRPGGGPQSRPLPGSEQAGARGSGRGWRGVTPRLHTSLFPRQPGREKRAGEGESFEKGGDQRLWDPGQGGGESAGAGFSICFLTR